MAREAPSGAGGREGRGEGPPRWTSLHSAGLWGKVVAPVLSKWAVLLLTGLGQRETVGMGHLQLHLNVQ